jgi:hypothetical protein
MSKKFTRSKKQHDDTSSLSLITSVDGATSASNPLIIRNSVDSDITIDSSPSDYTDTTVPSGKEASMYDKISSSIKNLGYELIITVRTKDIYPNAVMPTVIKLPLLSVPASISLAMLPIPQISAVLYSVIKSTSLSVDIEATKDANDIVGLKIFDTKSISASIPFVTSSRVSTEETAIRVKLVPDVLDPYKVVNVYATLSVSTIPRDKSLSTYKAAEVLSNSLDPNQTDGLTKLLMSMANKDRFSPEISP